MKACIHPSLPVEVFQNIARVDGPPRMWAFKIEFLDRHQTYTRWRGEGGCYFLQMSWSEVTLLLRYGYSQVMGTMLPFAVVDIAHNQRLMSKIYEHPNMGEKDDSPHYSLILWTEEDPFEAFSSTHCFYISALEIRKPLMWQVTFWLKFGREYCT